MAKQVSKAFDVFDFTGMKRKEKLKGEAKAAADARAEMNAMQAEKDKAAADKLSAEESAKQKLIDEDKAKSSARLAGIAGISDTLAKEGETEKRRRFLMGAK